MLRAYPPRRALAALLLLTLVSCKGQSPSEPASVAAVVVTPGSATIDALGGTVQLSAAAQDGGGGTLTGKAFVWASLAEDVATVTSTGTVTAVSNGTATITATADGISGSATVLVAQSVSSVLVVPGEYTLTALGDTVLLSAEARDSRDNPITDVQFNWASSEESVVEVTGTGEAYAVGKGSAFVSASTDGVSGSATVKVDQEVTEVNVVPPSATLTSLGETVALVAAGLDARGSTVEDVVFVWTSSAESVATVSEDGMVTAVEDGTTIVSATVDGVSGDASVVVDQKVDSVQVTPAVDTIVVGGVTALAASAFDALGSLVADATFAWSSDDETVATVDQSGMVTGLDPGRTPILAVSGGVAGESLVTVLASPSLACGDLTSASIAVAAEVDVYTFLGNGGDIVAFTLVETTNWGGTAGANDARLTLFDPAGTQIDQFDSNQQREFTLPQTGSYLIRISANNLAATGGYNLGLEGIAPPTPTPTALSCGDNLAGAITTAGQAQLWTFDGANGSTVTLTITETTNWGGTAGANDARLTLFNPAGTQIDQFDSDLQRQLTLPQTGTYLIRISANNLAATGGYQISLTCS